LMLFQNLHIILISVIVLLLVLLVLLSLNLKNKKQAMEKRVNSVMQKFENDKIYLEKEIKRQEFIIENYKHKYGNKQNKLEKSQETEITENPSMNEGAKLTKTFINPQSLLDEEEFRDKNKKLWELSIAVHKEKERIDKLRAEIEHRHDEVTKSITYAQRIQKALLPSSKILGVRFSDYFIFWKPKDIVSGDFYWIKRQEDSIIIVVADCTGHGVPGAFMSLLGISFLNDIVTKESNLKSFQILGKLREMIKLALHQELRDRSKGSDGIDMALCIINNKSLQIDYAGANNPLYLVRDDKVLIFEPNRNPVGIHPNEQAFKNHTFQLMKNDRCYMFSDGFVDQFGGELGRKFLKRNFQRLLLYISQQNLSMEEEKDVLEEAFLEWKGEHPQIDDILVLGIKI
jgi:serine phosphatase RsbU (regulator of sigma subunit)